ncbi:hypothetical protein M413DRAFT_259414 [Hebeloma cylindrosporum]|uniref:Uncharacterized protein n=1 Tax=Hebeloma cylindrosporum TaxID=76867 RepID=A0A0C3CRW0_HEBCY|nr:hypothetical protein M413DRAFT_259414 [Hebeloma cylindrosporum h7]
MRLLPTNLFLGYREMSGASGPPNTGLEMISCAGWATRKPFRRHRWSVVPIQAKCFRIGETDASFRIIMPLTPKISLSGQETCASVVRKALKTIGFRACVYASETELMGVLYRCQASHPGTSRCWRSISGRRSKRRLFPIIGQPSNSPLRYQGTLSNRALHLTYCNRSTPVQLEGSIMSSSVIKPVPQILVRNRISRTRSPPIPPPSHDIFRNPIHDICRIACYNDLVEPFFIPGSQDECRKSGT